VRFSRPGFAQGGAADAAGTLSAAGPAKASASDQAAPTAASPQIQSLFTLPDLDFDTLFAFGGTGYGSAEFGELAAAVNAINAAGASYRGYCDTFNALVQATATQSARTWPPGTPPAPAAATCGQLRTTS